MWLPYELRDRHIHIIGKSGMGKSTMLSLMAFKDIENGAGVCVIDPKGDLVDFLVTAIPPSREKDCIWIDIADPVPLDFMGCQPGQEDTVVADLKFILTSGALDTAAAPTLSSNIENILYTLLNANQSLPTDELCTFLDIADFFEDEARRKRILAHVSDPRLKRCWNEMPSKQDQARILSRINPFVRNATLSKIVGERQPRLDIRSVLSERKIILARLPVDNPSSAMYGALLVAKIQQATFSRAANNRPPFFLFIDEFQNFRATEAFEKVMEMARSFKLCLTLANLTLEHLDSRIVSALGIISTYILFRISSRDAGFYKPIIEEADPDAAIRNLYEKTKLDMDLSEDPEKYSYKLERLSDKMASVSKPPITIQDALSLPRFKAIYKLENVPAVIESSPEPAKLPTPERLERAERIKMRSNQTYGAQNRTIRTGDNASLHSRQVLQDEVNGQEHKSEEIAPSGSATIPVDDGKTKRP